MMKPLADLIRPRTLDEVVGQQHLIGEGQILRKLVLLVQGKRRLQILLRVYRIKRFIS